MKIRKGALEMLGISRKASPLNDMTAQENEAKQLQYTFTRAQELAGQKKGWENTLNEMGEHSWEFYQRPSYYQNVYNPLIGGGSEINLGGGNIRMLDEDGNPRYHNAYIPSDDGEIPMKGFVDNLDKTQLSPGYKWSGPIDGDVDGKKYYQQNPDPSKDFRHPLYPKEKFEDEDKKNYRIKE